MVEDKSRDQTQRTGTPSGSAAPSQRSGTSTPEVVTPSTATSTAASTATTMTTSTTATPTTTGMTSVIIPSEVREYMRSSMA